MLGAGGGQLSYDFAMSDKKYGYILIEYNGIQHYEANDYFGGEEKFKIQKEHDRRKRDYAKKHGYKLITIKYTYDTYESVEEYLDKELKKLGVKNDTKKEESVNDSVNLRSPSPVLDERSRRSLRCCVDRVSGSPYTSSKLRTDGQSEVGRGLPSNDDAA